MFHEIFAHLYGCRIYEAFSKLNSRFEQLLHSSSLLLRIGVRFSNNNDLSDVDKHIMRFHRHQISSIYFNITYLRHEFDIFFPINSTLERLESIVLQYSVFDISRPALHELTRLPRLFLLIIDVDHDVVDLATLYRIVFTLPVLKYYKCKIKRHDDSVSHLITTEKQFSSIEHLVIDYHCQLEELASIISHTPRLRRLSYVHPHDSLSKTEMIFPIALANLKQLSLRMSQMKFNQFQSLINEIHFQVEIFSFTTDSNDLNYLDASRWEILILNQFRHLQEFYLTCRGIEYPFNRYGISLHQRNEFTSPFWTGRPWLFQAKLYEDHIRFYIHWHQCGQKDLGIDYQSIQAGRLVIDYIANNRSESQTIMDIDDIRSCAVIHHLEIVEECVSLGLLTMITSSLPELKTLKIRSLPESQCKAAKERGFLCLTSKTNTITKIYVDELCTLEDFFMLLCLYPLMESLEIEYTGDMDVELLLQIISKTIVCNEKYRLRLLCFHVLRFEDDDDVPILRKLVPIIHSNKLSLNYTVQRIVDKFYLQWK